MVDATSGAENQFQVQKGLPVLAARLAIIFGTLALLSLAILVAGKLYGHTLMNAGHSTSVEKYQIVLANDVLSVPGNMIRRTEQRRGGLAKRLDLYVHWPDYSGFSEPLSHAFNDVDPQTNSIIFISITPRATTFDMAGRFDAVYTNVVTGTAFSGYQGLQSQALSPEHGYVDEKLFYSIPAGPDEKRFVARCQDDNTATGLILAACTTEIHVGETLTAQIRFPSRLLEHWQKLNATLPVFVKKLLANAKKN